MPDFDMAWSPAVEGLQDRVRERLSFHRRARLGVSVLPLTGQLAEHLGAKDGGLLVSEVEEESAAAKAGIRAGDVIQRVNGRRIEEVGDLNEELRRAAERDGVATLDLVRDRGAISVTAEIESPEPVRKRGRRM
jgi:S1-C subfamily serine protease